MGMIDLLIDENDRRKGLATFLISEALRHLSESGIALIHAQVPQTNEPSLNLLRKLGFEEVDYGVLYGK